MATSQWALPNPSKNHNSLITTTFFYKMVSQSPTKVNFLSALINLKPLEWMKTNSKEQQFQ